MRIDKALSLLDAFETGTLYIFGVEIFFSRIFGAKLLTSPSFNYADAVKLPYPEDPARHFVSGGEMSWRDIEMPYFTAQ